MDENKKNENQNYLSGFDSIEPTTPKKENTFNPTPMFSGMKPQNGYTVTPEGNFFTGSTNSNTENEVKSEVPAEEKVADSKPDVFNAIPKEDVIEKSTETPISAVVEPQVTSTQTLELTNEIPSNEKAEEPEKAAPPVFIPNGTYSYSAPAEPTENIVADKPISNNSAPDASNLSSILNSTPTNPIQPKNPKKKNKTKKYGAGVVVLSALLAAILGAGGGIFGVFFANKYLGNTDTASVVSKPEQDNSPQNVTNITVDETVNSSVEAVAKKAGPSIIGIRTTAAVTNFFGGSSEATGEGSGIIYSQDGYIITNYHVIESAVESTNSKVEVFLSSDTETAINATVIGYNIASDLAVVKIEKTGLPAIEFADSNKLSVGQYAIAIGNPGGLEFIGSVSSGVISGLNRSVAVGTGNTMSLIQTDAAINPGNSGGALVDVNGKLIGVNSIKLVSTGYEGMGFAIPSNTVKEICDNIIDKQNDPTPYLGIQISQSYTSAELIALGYPAGAVVVSVNEGSPAYESKIQRGDIITEFNGITVKDYKELENAIAQCKPGDSVTVKIFRAGRFYSSHINVAANNAQ